MIDHAQRINTRKARRKLIATAMIVAICVITAVVTTVKSRAEVAQEIIIEPRDYQSLLTIHRHMVACLNGMHIGLGDGAVLICKIRQAQP